MADATYNTPVYRSQGSTSIVIGAGGSIALDGGTIILSSATVGTFAKGFIPLNIASAREVGTTGGEAWGNATVTAGILSTVTVPLLDIVSTTDRTMRVTWSSGNSDPIQFGAIPPPLDYTTVNGALTIHLNIQKQSTGNQSANVEAQFWGGLGVAVSSGVTAALTSTSPTDYTITIPTTVPKPFSAGGQWNLVLIPSAHANDAIFLYGGSIEYAKAST